MSSSGPTRANRDFPQLKSVASFLIPSFRFLLEDLARNGLLPEPEPDPGPRPNSSTEPCLSSAPVAPRPSVPRPSVPQPSVPAPPPPILPPHGSAGPHAFPSTSSHNLYPPPRQPSYWRDTAPTRSWNQSGVAVSEPSSSRAAYSGGPLPSIATFLPVPYHKSYRLSADRLPRLIQPTFITPDSSQDDSQHDMDWSPSLQADFSLRPIGNEDRAPADEAGPPSPSMRSDDSLDGTVLESELPFQLRPVTVHSRAPTPGPSSQTSRRPRHHRGIAVPAPCVPGKLTKNGRPYSRTRPDELKVTAAQPNSGRKTWTQTEKRIAWEALREYQRQYPSFNPKTSTDEDQRLAYPEMWKLIMHRLPKRTYDGFLTWASKHWRRPTTRSKSRTTNDSPSEPTFEDFA